jgi:hypothetical protein
MITKETELLGENLPQFRCVHKSRTCLDLDANRDRRGGKSATTHLSYGATAMLT